MDHVKDISDLIETLVKSASFHALVVSGPAGLGKTTAVERALADCGRNVVRLGSYTTPLNLYNFLAENATEIVLLDDTSGVLESPAAMSILKAATGTIDGPRRVTWGSTRAASSREFEFSGKAILICNIFPSGGDAEAIRSRSLPYQVKFTPAEASALLTSAATSREHFRDNELAASVAKFLNEHRTKDNSDSINLRTLKMGYDLARNSPDGRWQQLLEKLVPTAETSPPTVVRELARSGLRPTVQEREFVRRTGLSSRTFFRLKRELGLSRDYIREH